MKSARNMMMQQFATRPHYKTGVYRASLYKCDPMQAEARGLGTFSAEPLGYIASRVLRLTRCSTTRILLCCTDFATRDDHRPDARIASPIVVVS